MISRYLDTWGKSPKPSLPLAGPLRPDHALRVVVVSQHEAILHRTGVFRVRFKEFTVWGIEQATGKRYFSGVVGLRGLSYDSRFLVSGLM